MFPLSLNFFRRNRPRPEIQKSIVEEEYEWVFGNRPQRERANRLHPVREPDSSQEVREAD